MTQEEHGRRPGIFEGLPRAAYRRAAARYVDLCAVGVLLHGLAVTAFGLLMLSLYLDLTPRASFFCTAARPRSAT